MQFQYELETLEQEFGDQRLRIHCIRDLNETIDRLFEDVEARGDTRLLEDLCPYFGVIWPSARALCETLATMRSELEGKTVLEIGCGLALPSLYCAKIGAHVTAADFHPEVPAFLQRNMELNQIRELRFLAYDWRNDGSDIGTYDRVLGSDILYESQHPAPVARALAARCAPGGRIFLADPARPYLQRFADEMKALGFSQKTRVVGEIFVLEFARPPNGRE